MINISKYTKLGFLVLACLSIMIWGINYLKGIDLFSRSNNYYVIYDNIDGLLKSSSVNINGYKVGQVTDIELMSDYSGRIFVTLALRRDFKIGKGSVAKISSTDIMGTKAVVLDINHSGEYYKSNDTIPGVAEGGIQEMLSKEILPVKKKAEVLIESLDSAMTIINAVFNPETQKNLRESFENINRTLANIQSVSSELNKALKNGRLNHIVGNIDSITGSIAQNSDQISNILENFSSISDSLSKINISPVFAEISSSVTGLNTILQKLNTNESTAGLLINDPTLYQNLSSLSKDIDFLMTDLKNNPKRYVHFSAFKFGKDVYINSKSAASTKDSEITYKIYLITSRDNISIESDQFKGLGQIEEMKFGNKYEYFTKGSPDFNKISLILEDAKIKFPDASVVAFKNGKKVKLEKSIQGINN